MKEKVCPECGKTFIPKNGYQKYCNGPHYTNCVICGKRFSYTVRPTEKPKTCSKECQTALRKQTCKTKYGVNNVSEIPEVRKKISEDHQSAQFKDKIRTTCQKKYGKDHFTQTDEFKAKQKKYFIEKYGVDNPAKIETSRYKLSKSLSSESSLKKRSETVQSHFGYGWTTQVPEVKAKMRATNMKKYGVPYYSLTKDFLSNKAISKNNKQFGKYLDLLGISYEFEYVVNDKSFDIGIPDQKILIEIDPSCSHYCNEYAPNRKYTIFPGVSKNYNLERTKIGEDNGYHVIHVFDWDDQIKIVKMLTNKIRVFARKCNVVNVKKEVATDFLNKYHLQNTVRGQAVILGLEFNNELIEIMTFGKPRYNKHYEWELLRLCTNPNYCAVGGASKLFNSFIAEYNPKSIISYCDYSKFTGDVYSSLGFRCKKLNSPSIIWSKKELKVTDNLLRARGYDQLFGTNFGRGTSNEALMLENSWLPVADCGQRVFEWKKSS